jgi:hypothetical protein
VITTEALLTHPRCFGLTTASPVQRAICRAADGIPLRELAQDETVQRVFGGWEAVDQLPREPPKEFYVVAAIRTAKSLISAALAVKIALTIDLSHLRQGEIARVSVVSVDKDKAEAVMEHLTGALEMEGGLLARHLVKKPKKTANRIYIRRADGRRVAIIVAAGRRGGSSLVSRWTVAAIFDEAARMQGQEDGVVNFEDMRKAVIARLSLMKGGQLIVVSSPWAARGPVYDATLKHMGKPTRFMVMVRATGPEMNPVLWTLAACEEVRLTDEASYITDVLGEFADAETGLFLAQDLARVTRKGADTLDMEPGWYYVAAMDPATKRNAWTLVILAYQPDPKGDRTKNKYRVAFAKQWQGTRLEPLKAKNILKEIGLELRKYGIREAWTDEFGSTLIVEIGEDMGVDVLKDDDTTSEKDARWLDFHRRVIGEQIELSPDPIVIADLLSARKRLTPNGVKIDLPVTKDGRHADFAPAVVLAVEKAGAGPSWANQFEAWREQNGVVTWV